MLLTHKKRKTDCESCIRWQCFVVNLLRHECEQAYSGADSNATEVLYARERD